jgi:hypothetical protein
LSYNNDMNQAFDAIEQATWLPQDEYVQYVRSFHEYEKERSDCLSALVAIIALPDADVASSWTAALGLGAIALAQIKDTVPGLREGDPNLGLAEWTDRETQMYESLKAEQFLRARQDLIAMKEETTQAAELLDDKWNEFYEQTQTVNSELVEKQIAFKDKLTNWAKTSGDAAALLSQATGGVPGVLGAALTAIKIVGQNARQLRPALEAVNMKMQAKRPNWETLNQLNEFQEAILERIEPGVIERMLGEASFGDVSGSEDFKAFTADALDALVKVHQQGALTASEEYRKVAADKFAERSSSTIENITQLDSLGKSLQEVVGIQQLVEGESLKSIEDSIGNMRDGPEKDEAVDGLKEAREGLQELIDDEAKDMDEYKSEADKIK